ncbi:MAG: gliding motility-associated C-terminal domain-containing protein, partial [Saprospiraceae bacterium]|nr:gliding motility-associated C-terminal domain-containing protein [Saprospiraceae bacterium]
NQAITAELCNLADAAVDLSVLGGLAPFTYLWDSGQTTEDLSGIGGGNYAVTVSGANNCTASAVLVVPENDIPFSLAGAANPNTSCVVLNGGIDLNVSPPVPPAGPGYTYSWSSGQMVEDLSAIPPGSYVVTVSAGGTCTNTAVFVVNDGAGSPSLSENIVEALCGQSSGSINITVNGGFTPYTYVWSNGAVTEDLSSMPSGNYAVTVTGDNGCSVIGSYVIPEGVVTPQLSGIPAPNTACVGPNGSINLAISPANLTYLIQWSNGANQQDLSNLTPGTYTVTVNGGGACTASASYVVGNNTNLVSAAGTDIDVLCFGDNTGSINLNLSGGTQPFEFNWSVAGIGNVEDPGSLVAGTYAVTVTDAVGCSATASFNITQPNSATQVTCAAINTVSEPGFADGSGQAIIAGGVAPYDVLLSPGGNQTGIAAGTLPINGLTVGAYTVQVTDANGCTAICDFDIALATCETALGQMGASQEALCGQGCITANYDALGQYLDPDDLLQFVLHQGAGAAIVGELSRSNTPTFCFNPAQMTYGTVYYVSAVAGNNDGTGNVNLDHYCTIITTGTPIVFYEKPVASIAPPAEITCALTQVVLAGSSNMPNSIFLWSTINGNIIGATDQPDIQTDQAGTYALQVSANGCIDTTYSDVLDIRNDPVAEILASPDDILDCVIDQIILAGEIKGSGNANAIWFDQNGATYPGGTVLQIDQPGTYWFAIVDTLTFCSDTASIIIGEDQIYPPLFINPPALLTCTNGAVTLSGGSPIGGISFTWAVLVGQDTVVIGAGASTSVSQPGEYLLIGIDPANGCDNAMAVTVVADQSFPTAEAGPPFNLDCYGQTASLNGSATGGTGQLTYAWTTSGGVILTGANTPSPLISEPGTYTLLVTALGNGCSDTDVVVVTPNEPRATLRVEDPNCFGEKGSITVDSVAGAKPPVEFTLTGGQHSQSGNTFFGLAPGAYTVLIEDADGCATEVEATIVQPPPFEVTVEPQVYLQLGESYVVDATVNVPESEIDLIQWTPATWLSCDTCLSTQIDTPLYSQQYEILVITKAGCRDEAPLLLRVNRQVNVYIPNIFSPNGDGDNDFFTVFADLKGVRKVNSLQIYSRWGEQVFQRYDFQPNQLELGWDGRFRGLEMNPAVFVYYAIVEFIDGQEVLFKGDVTLER